MSYTINPTHLLQTASQTNIIGSTGPTGPTGPTGSNTIQVLSSGTNLGPGITTINFSTNLTASLTGTNTAVVSGKTSMSTRTTANATTTLLANNETGNITITGFKSYALLKVSTSHACWVRIYTDVASRTADASRTIIQDPTSGSGVISEVITSVTQSVLISPATIGFNNEATPTSNIPVAITNLSGSAAQITVTLTLLQLEV